MSDINKENLDQVSNLIPQLSARASIKVLGVGGGGCNAVNSMAGSDLGGVEFIIANTDAQSLQASPIKNKIQLGMKITKGLGAGANPDVGRRAAEEDLEIIMKNISDADILFLTAGTGGGTGSGATPVIASAAKELGILTVAVVCKPFLFEGKKRQKQAEDAIESLRKYVDTLIVIPNQKLLEISDSKISMLNAFAKANDVLTQAIKGVSDIIVKPGHINVDFADVKAIMKGMGMAIMGTGKASGENRATTAALNAISSPLIENVCIDGAKGVLINITGNSNLGLHEIAEAANIIYNQASEDANIILGSVVDDSVGDEIIVTVIATGFINNAQKEKALMSGAIKAKDKEQVSKSLVKQEPALIIPAQDEMAMATKSAEMENMKNNSAMLDLNDLDTPTFMRKKAEAEK